MAGTVTLLKIQKQNKERVSVFLDDAYAFSLDLIAAARLHKGQHLSDAEIDALQGDDERTRAYHAALRQLGVRPRSRSELEQALRRKEFDDEVIDAALARLQQEGLLDDAEFARYWSENRSTFRPRSARALRFELRQKGVSSEDMDPALEEVDDDAASVAALEPKLRGWQSLAPQEREAKALAFLARRGFSFQCARRALRTLLEP